jgi:hypothetical protein
LNWQAAAVSGVQVPPPQTLLMPPPPQVVPFGHGWLQLSEPPQPLPTIPQYWPPAGMQVTEVGQVAGAPQAFGMPAPPQVWPVGQLLPQSTEPPQPSPMTPQNGAPLTEQARFGTQPVGAHRFETPPPPHAWPVGQPPHASCASQPSPIVPQYWPPAGLQVSFVQFGLPQTFGRFAPHTVPFGQALPQSTWPPQPSPITPQ